MYARFHTDNRLEQIPAKEKVTKHSANRFHQQKVMTIDLPVIFELWLQDNGLTYNGYHSTDYIKLFIYPVPNSGDHIEFRVDRKDHVPPFVSVNSTSPDIPTSTLLRRPRKESQAKTLLWFYSIETGDATPSEIANALDTFIDVLRQNGFNNATFSLNTYVKVIEEDSFQLTIDPSQQLIEVINGLKGAESWMLPIPQTQEQIRALLWLHGLDL